jgi:hypothetical protein
MNKKDRRRDIRNNIEKLKPSIVGLLKTKVRSNKSLKVQKCFPAPWSYCANYTYSPKGRIWVAWDSNIWEASVISSSLQ